MSSHDSHPHIDLFQHTGCYCEENVFKLIETLLEMGTATHAELFVCFISNTIKKVPIWMQKSSKRRDGSVLWDYHVIALSQRTRDQTNLIWDLDTTLPFPCPLSEYIEKALPDIEGGLGMGGYERLYRVIPSEDYLGHFASDRSHMKRGDGSWLAPPPPWPCIRARTDGCVNRIEEYWSMHMDHSDEDGRLGRVTRQLIDASP